MASRSSSMMILIFTWSVHLSHGVVPPYQCPARGCQSRLLAVGVVPYSCVEALLPFLGLGALLLLVHLSCTLGSTSRVEGIVSYEVADLHVRPSSLCAGGECSPSFRTGARSLGQC